MFGSRWHIQLVGGASLSLIAITVGCQSVRGEMRGALQPPPRVPPLSASPDSTGKNDNAHLAAAPLQLAQNLSPAPSGSIPPLIPTLPVATQTPSAADPSLRPTPSHAAPPLPGKPDTRTGVETGQIRSAPLEACVPSDSDWRQQMEEQTAALMKRLVQVEGELTSTRTQLRTVHQSLQASETRIEELSQEVIHWKGEVTRLETEMRTQQLSDLKALDELTESMHQVLLSQQGQPPQAKLVK